MWNFRNRVSSWLKCAAEWIAVPQNDETSQSKFLNLAPTDEADKNDVYSKALLAAMDDPQVLNIALTGPYGSGKSSIIRSFLKKHPKKALEISLAAFIPETGRKVNTAASDQTGITPENSNTSKQDTDKATKQEIERSILQQMLYGADANKLPFSRFKRIQTPRRWSSIFISLYLPLALFSCWHLFQKRDAVVKGEYFLPFEWSNWFNLTCFALGVTLLWFVAHRVYVASFAVSLKSLSLKDIQITPAAIDQESILNCHLDEIIYFFQSTDYDLVIIEDLDRFNDPEIFVTLREINKIVNDNSGVKRTIRFLYALRDDMFVNTDRTKFFEFIVPVIPIINSSNFIDMVIKEGARLSLDDRLDRQFLREVSRYLGDLRLIRNIFNEYAIYAANLNTDDDNVWNANKLLAVLIYKNICPSDFEDLHRGRGSFAQILGRHNEFVMSAEAECKAEISRLEQQIEVAEKQLPASIQELRKIYAMAVIQKLPEQANYLNVPNQTSIPINSLTNDGIIEELIGVSNILYRSLNGHQANVDISGFEGDVSETKTFNERKDEIEYRSAETKEITLKKIREQRNKI